MERRSPDWSACCRSRDQGVSSMSSTASRTTSMPSCPARNSLTVSRSISWSSSSTTRMVVIRSLLRRGNRGNIGHVTPARELSSVPHELIVPRVHEVVVVVGVVTFQTGPFRRKAPDRLAGRTLDMAASRAVTDLALHVPQAAVRLENREPAVAVQAPPRGISRTWKTGGDASSKVEVAQRAVGDAGGNRAIFPGGRLHFPANTAFRSSNCTRGKTGKRLPGAAERRFVVVCCGGRYCGRVTRPGHLEAVAAGR